MTKYPQNCSSVLAIGVLDMYVNQTKIMQIIYENYTFKMTLITTYDSVQLMQCTAQQMKLCLNLTHDLVTQTTGL